MKRIAEVLCLLLVLMMASCGPEDPITPETLSIGDGVFVLNEGPFASGGYGVATLTFYNTEMDTSAHKLFYRANGGAVLGDTGQSLTLIGDKLYIVVNNSNWIYKVDANTIVYDTMITDFCSPRYMLPVSPEKAYVSDLACNDLWIINPQEMTHTGSIDMGKPTETMVQVGREIYVTNWSRYYNQSIQNNTVQVINIDQDEKIAEIEVGYEPNGMVVDKHGFVWVLSEGDVNDLDIPSTLWKIDTETKTATLVITFERRSMNLAIDPSKTYLYYCYGSDWSSGGGEVRRINVDHPDEDDAFSIPADDRLLYKIAVDPENGDIYVSDAKNYMVDGRVYRYSSEGELISSFAAGICPSYMLFN